MNLYNEEFFEEVFSLIYEWLSEGDKIQLKREISNQEFPSFDELSPMIRFFRLLNFIEVRYIKIENWIDKTSELLETFRLENEGFNLSDLVIIDDNKQTIKFSNLTQEITSLNLIKKD